MAANASIINNINRQDYHRFTENSAGIIIFGRFINPQSSSAETTYGFHACRWESYGNKL